MKTLAFICILIFLTACTVEQPPPQPTFWYQFNGDPTDGMGQLDLTAVNGPTFNANDKVEGTHAALLDGVDDYFETKSFPTDYDNITIAAWVKPIREKEHHYVFGQKGLDPSNSYDLQLYVYWSDELLLQIYSGVDQDTRATFPQGYKNNWIHLAAVISNGNPSDFYMNGQPVQVYTDQDSTVLSQREPIMRIGARAHPTNLLLFDGFIDDYRIWIDTSISDEDILKVYQEFSPKK